MFASFPRERFSHSRSPLRVFPARLIRFVFFERGNDDAVSICTRNGRVKSENRRSKVLRRHGRLDVAQIGRPPGFPYTLTRHVRSPPANIAFLVGISVCAPRVCARVRERERLASAMGDVSKHRACLALKNFTLALFKRQINIRSDLKGFS